MLYCCVVGLGGCKIHWNGIRRHAAQTLNAVHAVRKSFHCVPEAAFDDQRPVYVLHSVYSPFLRAVSFATQGINSLKILAQQVSCWL